MNGHSINEDDEIDMYSMLVPAEESQLIKEHSSNTVSVKQILTARNYFHYNEE